MSALIALALLAAASGSVEPTTAPDPDHRVVICHKGREIEVDEAAIPGHLGHGDHVGPCELPSVSDTPEVEPSTAPDPDHRVVICHKGREIEVDEAAVPGHVGHGDHVGPCELPSVAPATDAP